MQQRRMLLVVTIVLVVVAIGMTLWWFLSRRIVTSETPPTVQEPKMKVVVAAMDLPQGITLIHRDVQVAEVPVGKAPQDVVTDTSEAVGAILTRDVREGTPLQRRFLQPPPEKLRGFSVPMGLRGVVLYQPFTEGAADILLPGDWVDVIATKKEGEVTVAEVIVRRAQVLVAEDYAPGMTKEERLRQQALTEAEKATPPLPEAQPGQQGQPQEQARPTPTMRRLVLAVTPKEAVRLVRAMDEGRALTVLRNRQDFLPIPILRSPAARPVRRPEERPPTTRPVTTVAPMVRPMQTIVVYRGTQREEIFISR